MATTIDTELNVGDVVRLTRYDIEPANTLIEIVEPKGPGYYYASYVSGMYPGYIYGKERGCTHFIDEGDEFEVVSRAEAEESISSDAGLSDAVSQPSHYTAGDIEVIDIIAQTVAGYDDPFVGHCVGTATKYLNRAPYKHETPVEDLRKAERYIQFAIEHLTKDDEK